MPIVRSNATERYFKMHNVTAQDSSLSWAARGMLAYLLSKSEGWKPSLTDLARQSPAGLDACRTIIAELIDARYVKRVEVRHKGRIDYDTTVYDRPHDTTDISLDPPHPVQPHAVGPDAVKPTPYKEQNVKNTEIENTEGSAPAARTTAKNDLVLFQNDRSEATGSGRRMTFRQANASGCLKEQCVRAACLRFADHDWPDIEWDLLWEEFEQYWGVEAPRKTKVDWPATFYNRAMDRRTWSAYRKGDSNARRKHTGNTALVEAASDLIRQYDAEDSAGRNPAHAGGNSPIE